MFTAVCCAAILDFYEVFRAVSDFPGSSRFLFWLISLHKPRHRHEFDANLHTFVYSLRTRCLTLIRQPMCRADSATGHFSTLQLNPAGDTHSTENISMIIHPEVELQHITLPYWRVIEPYEWPLKQTFLTRLRSAVAEATFSDDGKRPVTNSRRSARLIHSTLKPPPLFMIRTRM